MTRALDRFRRRREREGLSRKALERLAERGKDAIEDALQEVERHLERPRSKNRDDDE